MTPTIINLITKNPGKLLAAQNAFKKYKISVNQITKEFPEIQADTSLEIAKYTALQAASEFQLPIIREDHSMIINALGIPGPYTSFIEKHLSAEKLLEILKTQKDRSGYMEVATVYAEPNGFTLEYSYKVPILFGDKIVVPDPKNGWSGIIRLVNETRALTEYPEEERVNVWNKNYIAIAEFLTNRQK